MTYNIERLFSVPYQIWAAIFVFLCIKIILTVVEIVMAIRGKS